MGELCVSYRIYNSIYNFLFNFYDKHSCGPLSYFSSSVVPLLVGQYVHMEFRGNNAIVITDSVLIKTF